MNCADQARVIRIVADQRQVEIGVVGFQQHGGAADRQFADTPAAKAAADHQAFGVAPGLQLEEAPDHGVKLLREILDGALHHARRLGVALDQQFLKMLLGDLVGFLIAKGVGAAFAHHVAPLCQEVAEGAFVGAVADKALIVFHLDIVAFDGHRGQARGAMRQARRQSALIGHLKVPNAATSQQLSRGRGSTRETDGAGWRDQGGPELRPRHARFRMLESTYSRESLNLPSTKIV